jgi:predicted ribosome quality control (RQC) complex YloA/Tae2 family protein
VASLRTSPELIARLAAELDARFSGSRVRDVGRLPDGRTAIVLWSRGSEHALCIDVFGTPPMVTVEDGLELPIEVEPGFIRAAGAALRGSTLLAVRARKDDRLLRLTFGTRSRFGVGDESELFIELVPRFGNIVLVRKDRIVASLKEFSLAENGTRAVEAGQTYALPPLVARAAQVPVQIEADASVLDYLRSSRAQTQESSEAQRTGDRRKTLIKRLDEREKKVRRELAALEEKRRAAGAREQLREAGEAVYGTLHELDESARDEAKTQATALFARYKKLGASVSHLDTREASLRAALTAIEQLHWEAERIDDADLPDVEAAATQLDPRAKRARSAPVRRKRTPLEVRTPSGSRIVVGRSPSENADLTFKVARPNDWWFHAQNIPGAHVILQRDDRSEPPADDIERAASLAAYFSKARASAKVAIDYTLRKYVRAQRDAPPGLVWYTHPRTIMAEPAPP